MLVGRVVEHEVDEHAHPALTGGGDQVVEILEAAEARIDAVVVGDVVAAVASRRGIERQQPEGVDPQPAQVRQALAHASQISGPVPVAVAKGRDVDRVDDGVRPLGADGSGHGRRVPRSPGFYAPAGTG